MHFYVSIFKDSKVGAVTRSGPGPDAPVFSVTFTLDGAEFYALNGGPMYHFTPAVSFFISCESQEEVDHYWSRLVEGGEEHPCGWLKDRFGLSWQVIPTALGRLMGDKDRTKAGRAVQAMMGMKKIDIAGLQRAFEGK